MLRAPKEDLAFIIRNKSPRNIARRFIGYGNIQKPRRERGALVYAASAKNEMNSKKMRKSERFKEIRKEIGIYFKFKAKGA